MQLYIQLKFGSFMVGPCHLSHVISSLKWNLKPSFFLQLYRPRYNCSTSCWKSTGPYLPSPTLSLKHAGTAFFNLFFMISPQALSWQSLEIWRTFPLFLRTWRSNLCECREARKSESLQHHVQVVGSKILQPLQPQGQELCLYVLLQHCVQFLSQQKWATSAITLKCIDIWLQLCRTIDSQTLVFITCSSSVIKTFSLGFLGQIAHKAKVWQMFQKVEQNRWPIWKLPSRTSILWFEKSDSKKYSVRFYQINRFLLHCYQQCQNPKIWTVYGNVENWLFVLFLFYGISQ